MALASLRAPETTIEAGSDAPTKGLAVIATSPTSGGAGGDGGGSGGDGGAGSGDGAPTSRALRAEDALSSRLPQREGRVCWRLSSGANAISSGAFRQSPAPSLFKKLSGWTVSLAAGSGRARLKAAESNKRRRMGVPQKNRGTIKP
ncbi:hypothetical protein [Candidatus Phycosocius spiralis]|nr:hypothetical protein [Candidatus Phycosocius spiralis]